jgi:hypothetical protein
MKVLDLNRKVNHRTAILRLLPQLEKLNGMRAGASHAKPRVDARPTQRSNVVPDDVDDDSGGDAMLLGWCSSDGNVTSDGEQEAILVRGARGSFVKPLDRGSCRRS